MHIVTLPVSCAAARFMARRSALVGRSRIHSANVRIRMDATITPMDPPEARDKVRLGVVVPEPDDQREDQRQSGGQGGELVEYQGERADGMRDQPHASATTTSSATKPAPMMATPRYIASI